ncbi:MAG: type II secretion system F family protein [Phycisphaerales bacterium]|nr:type II secretion system F family protein [Phycisphaerales bacterium]
MKFSYEAYTKTGASKNGTIEAADQREAEDKLRRKDLLVTKIHNQDVSGGKSHSKSNKSAPKKNQKSPQISVKVVSEFARELSVLVSTGTPLVDAIHSLEMQANSEKLQAVLEKLRLRLEEGDSLSEAMELQSEVFGPIFCSLSAAGESGGNLDVMLNRVSKLLRQEAKIRANIAGAMMYPILLTAISIVVITVMIGLVLPRFAELFESLDSELPPTTEFLMLISTILRSYWWGIIPGVVAAIGGLVFWIRSDKGRSIVEANLLKVPVLGSTLSSIQTARIFRVLGLLVESKVPILESIELTRRSVSNTLYKDLLTTAEESVTIGEPVSTAFSTGNLIVPSAVEAVRNAEQSGRMGPVMIQLADYLDEENETVIKSISSLIEPIIMIGLGIMVAFIAISMFLPLFDLTASAGQ